MGIYGGGYGYFVQNYAEKSINNGEEFLTKWYSLDADNGWGLDEEIAEAMKGIHTIKNNTLYVYLINGKATTEKAYNNALYLEEYPAGSEFATYEGTYNDPIRPD